MLAMNVYNLVGGFSPAIIFIFGIMLFFLELAVPGVVIIWFGMGAVLLSGIEYFYPLDIITQILGFTFLSILFLVVYKKVFFKIKTDMPDNYFIVREGEGKIVNKMVEFQSTYWKYSFENNEKFKINDGDTVYVSNIENNSVIIRKEK
jgi:membrane protein implicated in regulation of membrane protease activity